MSDRRVESLLSEVGFPTTAAANATIVGHDPVLGCRFPVGEAAAAALAACASVAALLWEERTCEEQQVVFDRLFPGRERGHRGQGVGDS